MSANQNSSFSQSKISSIVDETLKDFDITKLQELGYEKIQKLADEYLASVNPEIKEIGQELKDIDPKIFQLTKAEEKLKKIHTELLKKGKTKLQADSFGIKILQIASESVTQQIIGAMNTKSYDEWQNLQGHGPNIFQQLYLLDETSKILLGKSFDELYEESLQKAVNLTLSLLKESESSLTLINGLTQEQAQNILTAFNANQYEIAIQLIFDFARDNEQAE